MRKLYHEPSESNQAVTISKTMIKLNPYLNYMGRTEEAFAFYKKIFGGEFAMVQRFSDTPDFPGKEKLPASDLNKIMHIALPIGNEMLMATDALESMGHTLTVGNNVSLSLNVDSKAEADRIFTALASEVGKAEMLMQDMFWNAYFGIVDDKFGVKWMVNCDTK
jgi:PhnB protein